MTGNVEPNWWERVPGSPATEAALISAEKDGRAVRAQLELIATRLSRVNEDLLLLQMATSDLAADLCLGSLYEADEQINACREHLFQAEHTILQVREGEA